MRRTFSAVLAAVCAVALSPVVTASQATVVTERAAAPWTLVVDDRFNAGRVPRHWSRYDGPYGSGPENCARPDHASVRNGKLRMVLRYRADGRCGAGWYSAGMMLDERFESVSQKIRIRFRVRTVDGVRGHRIIPMRWPSSGDWPDAGEEDYCEGSDLRGCSTFLHGPDERESHHYRVNLRRWHTMTFVRRGFTVRAFIDGKRRWVYRGDRSTLPATLKRPVLQQECQSDGCPSGRQGREVILIDWVKVWNPS